MSRSLKIPNFPALAPGSLPVGRPGAGPGADAGVTEAMIFAVVATFYGRVRQHPVLGPIFDRAIGGGWDEHLAKLCDFWSSVVLTTGRFKGSPMMAHARNGEVRPEHFEAWLALFADTAREICPPAAAELFVAKAEMIGRSLRLGLGASR